MKCPQRFQNLWMESREGRIGCLGWRYFVGVRRRPEAINDFSRLKETLETPQFRKSDLKIGSSEKLVGGFGDRNATKVDALRARGNCGYSWSIGNVGGAVTAADD